MLTLDKSHEACTACQIDTGGLTVGCIGCRCRVHPSCYDRARTERDWSCDLCDSQYLDVRCGLCQHHDPEYQQIMTKVPAQEATRMRMAQADHPLAPKFAHEFCIRLSRHPQATKETNLKCHACHQPHARIKCGHEGCNSAYHPLCALQQRGVLTVGDDAQWIITCSKHKLLSHTCDSNGAATSTKSPKVKIEPGSNSTTVPVPTRVPVPKKTTITSTATSTAPASTVPPPKQNNFIVATHPPSNNATRGTDLTGTSSAHLRPALSIAQSNSTFQSSAMIVGPVSSYDPKNFKVATPAASASELAAASKNKSSTVTLNKKLPTVASVSSVSSSTTNKSTTAKPSSTTLSIAATTDSKKESAKERFQRERDTSSTSTQLITNSNGKTRSKSPPPSPPAAAASSTVTVPIPRSSTIPPSVSRLLATPSTHVIEPTKSKKRTAAGSSEERKTSTAAEPPKKKKKLHRPVVSSSESSSTSDSDSDDGHDSDTSTRRRTRKDKYNSQIQSTEEDTKKKQELALKDVQSIRDEEKELDNDVCRICGENWSEYYNGEEGPVDPDDPDDWNDALVECDGCGLGYHQSCYGIRRVPEGEWKCWPCKYGLKKGEVTCVICKSNEARGFCEVKYARGTKAVIIERGGPMLKGKHFAHTVCVLWQKDTSFGDPLSRNPAIDIEKIPNDLFKIKCSQCPRKGGAVIQCQHGECCVSFHVLCMLRDPTLNYFDAHENDDDTPEGYRPAKEFYCRFHSRKPLLERKKRELLEEGKTEEAEKVGLELDQLILDSEKVVVTKKLYDIKDIVRNVPLKGGKRIKKVIEVDPQDQETRAAAYEQKEAELKVKLEQTRMKQVEDEETKHADEDEEMVDMTTNPKKRKPTSALDADIDQDEDVESDSSGGRKRLKKLGEKRLKLEVTSDASTAANLDEKKKPMDEVKLASSHPLSVGYTNRPISSSTNPTIQARSRIRQKLSEYFDAETSNDIEAELWRLVNNEPQRDLYLYKRHARDFLSSVTSNPELIEQVRCRTISPHQLVHMNKDELAPTALRQARQEEHKEDIRAHTAKTQELVRDKSTGTYHPVDLATGNPLNLENGLLSPNTPNTPKSKKKKKEVVEMED